MPCPSRRTLSTAGQISDTPMNTGTFNFTMTATNSNANCSGSQSYSITIPTPTPTPRVASTPTLERFGKLTQKDVECRAKTFTRLIVLEVKAAAQVVRRGE